MKRIVSFCVFGTDPMYQVGALENAELVHRHYPDWTPLFHVSTEVPQEVTARLRELGAEVVPRVLRRREDGMMWRMRPASARGLDALVVRDTDSRIGAREAAAVEEWLASGRDFHIMRDHPDHRFPVMGGMWGCRGKVLPHIPTLVFLWRLLQRATGSRAFRQSRGSDQIFLREMIYPLVCGDAMIHSDLVRFEGEDVRPFPTPREDLEFVGQIIRADGSTNEHHRELLANAEPRAYSLYPPSRLTRWIAALRKTFKPVGLL